MEVAGMVAEGPLPALVCPPVHTMTAAMTVETEDITHETAPGAVVAGDILLSYPPLNSMVWNFMSSLH